MWFDACGSCDDAPIILSMPLLATWLCSRWLQACGTGVNLQVMPTSAPRPAHPQRQAEGADGSGQLGLDGSASTLSLCQVRSAPAAVCLRLCWFNG